MFDKGWISMFKQAQDLQSKMGDIQKELADKTVEASVGGGMVTVRANGIGEVIFVHIDDELINMQDREVLEDLMMGAFNEVQRKVKDLAQSEMSRITGGLKIPGLFPPG
jgi:DNA-binding YbaB/EbfC family protein